MSTTITATTSGDTTSPIAIDGYEADRQSQNLVHDLIGGGIAVALIAPRPRSGILQLVYENQADAVAAMELHAEKDTFTLERDDITAVNMTYVLADGGSVRIAVNSTRTAWTVAVGYQEVTP